VSACRRQAMLEAPVESVWELVGNPARHPEWWPKVIEVRGERFAAADEYVQVTRNPLGRAETTTFAIEQLDDDLRQIRMRCLATGMYAHWRLTAAQEGTFVDLELGMDPLGFSDRAFDRIAGKTYFRRWAESSLDGLKGAARAGST
jgi:Polyketide cyclase / dehydrase and lipid transport